MWRLGGNIYKPPRPPPLPSLPPPDKLPPLSIYYYLTEAIVEPAINVGFLVLVPGYPAGLPPPKLCYGWKPAEIVCFLTDYEILGKLFRELLD